jgi:hypothetical protein
VHRLALLVPPAGGPREQLVPGAEARSGAVHPDPVRLAAGDQVPQRIIGEQRPDLLGQREAGPGERITGLTECLCGFDEWIAQLAGQAGGGLLQQPGADDEVVGQLTLALARVEFRGDRTPPCCERVAPAVDPERPQPDAVWDELTEEDIGRSA